jgi:hypothetical protein
MNVTRVIVSAGTVLALAACGGAPATAHTAATSNATASAAARARAALATASAACASSGGTWNGVSCSTPPPPANTGTTDGSPFACSTVVDSDDSTSPFKVVANGGSLTAQDAIAYLEALTIADLVNLSAGNVSTTAVNVLDGTRLALENYHLDKLADDAQQFAGDEQSYNPDGPVDASQWSAVQADILTLGKDCPKALAEAMSIDRGGS